MNDIAIMQYFCMKKYKIIDEFSSLYLNTVASVYFLTSSMRSRIYVYYIPSTLINFTITPISYAMLLELHIHLNYYITISMLYNHV